VGGNSAGPPPPRRAGVLRDLRRSQPGEAHYKLAGLGAAAVLIIPQRGPLITLKFGPSAGAGGLPLRSQRSRIVVGQYSGASAKED
jgi:hypothetical protein